MKIIKKIKIFLEMIKFPHTIFALPFAFVGAILAARGIPTAYQLLWILIAMISARTGSMSLNRIIDKNIDARNPRTKNRALPAGLLSITEVSIVVIISFLVLFLAAYKLNLLCVKLYPLVVVVLIFYSFTKRFTSLSHLFLGLALGLAPIGGWVAIAGTLNIAPFILSLAVITWVAGFDIIYACQDEAFDKQNGLFSIPQRFGIKKALRIAIIFHLLTIAFFFWLYLNLNLGIYYLAGIVIVILLLIYEHSIISENDLKRINTAFFISNAIVSTSILTFTLLDVLIL